MAQSLPPSAKRRLRNYLLDPRFQLGATLRIVGVAAVVALVLGAVLLRSTADLRREAEAAVAARSQAAETSRELGRSALNNQLLEHFSDPAFAESLRELSGEVDARFERERAAILAQQKKLIRQQQLIGYGVGAGLLGFLVLVAFGSIVATHKIVGPAYRLKQLMQSVREGSLILRGGLRDGDELKDVYEVLAAMVEELRREHEALSDTLDRALECAAHAPEALRAELLAAREVVDRRLGRSAGETPDEAPEARALGGER